MNWLRRFMIGRHGMDQLSMALLIVSILFSILSRFFASSILNALNMVFLFIILYRTFSKDISRRYQENNKFLQKYNPIKNKVNNQLQRIKNRKYYRYYKCSACKQKLRVPKGKGKVTVTCPKCKMTMIKKT